MSASVLGPSSQERPDLDISNPRVLSDMGLAIPRPTRLPPVLSFFIAGLGDPRSSSMGELENIISFANPSPKGHVGSKTVLLQRRGCVAINPVLLSSFGDYLKVQNK